MPKLKQSESDMFYKNILGNIEKQRVLYDIASEELAASARISKSTLDRRRKIPQEFGIEELRLIAKKLKMPLSDMLFKK